MKLIDTSAKLIAVYVLQLYSTSLSKQVLSNLDSLYVIMHVQVRLIGLHSREVTEKQEFWRICKKVFRRINECPRDTLQD